MDSQEPIIARREVERALLGSILIDPNIFPDVKRIVIPEDFMDAKFYKGRHARIFRAMLSSQRPNVYMVAQELYKKKAFEKGDSEYLGDLIANSPSPYDWDYYCQAILTYSGRKYIPNNQYKGIEL